MKTNDKLSFASEFVLVSLELRSHTGTKFDLTNQYHELSLYEDIFTNTVYGNIMIGDSLALLANLPIIGEEIIYIEYRTPSFPEEHTVKYFGYVYKVTDVNEYSDKGQTYLIHFTSIETILDANKKVSKYFEGQISHTVDNIFHNDKMLGSDKLLNLEETANQLKFTSPFWSPIKIINHLASQSLSKDDKAPSYLFFETLRGDFNFVSMNYLVAPDKVAKLTYRKNHGHTRDIRQDGNARNLNNEYSIITSYYIDEMFDYLARLSNGLYSSRLIQSNPISKSIRVTSQDYLESFDKHNHLNRYPVMSSDAPHKKNAALSFAITQEYSHDGQRNIRMDEWFLQRRSLLSQIHDVFRMDIEVAGRTDVHAGDVVNIEIMKPQPANRGDTNKDNMNNYYTGRFLIGAINHKFSGNKHTMIMQCITDSLGKKL